MIPAARIAWALTHGDPGPRWVLHLCNGGSGAHGCVRPDHLTLGDAQLNVDHKMIHGRHRIARGEQSGQARLTVDQVLCIRALRLGGWRSTVLARLYGVNHSTISAIVTRKNWAHAAFPEDVHPDAATAAVMTTIRLAMRRSRTTTTIVRLVRHRLRQLQAQRSTMFTMLGGPPS
jgi:hypothetical protein